MGEVQNVSNWIEHNKDSFQPPVCVKMMHDDQIMVFFVGGPNQRADYHLEEGEEFFYMVKGDMCLKVMEHGKFIDIPIREGEVFHLPAKILHSPQRVVNTVGLVIERRRAEDELEALRYFVEGSDETLYEEWMHLTDVGKQLPAIIKRFFDSEQYKTGKPIPGTITENPPIKVDHDRTLQRPFLLKDWLVDNRNDIHAAGGKLLFGAGNQCEVRVCGAGGYQGCHEVSQTWLWQQSGSAKVEINSVTHILNCLESILIPINNEFKVTGNNDDSFTLMVDHDPRKKNH